MSGPWREPDAETQDYPGLWVHDGRVSGSITIGQSRLPLWAIIATAIHDDWGEVEDGWSPGDGFDAEALADFLHDLLNARGEFGRLLLTIAAAERGNREADDAVLDAHTDATGDTLVKIWPPGPDTVTMPAPWWESDHAEVVADALRRCLAALERSAG